MTAVRANNYVVLWFVFFGSLVERRIAVIQRHLQSAWRRLVWGEWCTLLLSMISSSWSRSMAMEELREEGVCFLLVVVQVGISTYVRSYSSRTFWQAKEEPTTLTGAFDSWERGITITNRSVEIYKSRNKWSVEISKVLRSEGVQISSRNWVVF